MYNGRESHVRKPYNTIKPETRGRVGKEIKVITSFWKANTMDDMITKTPEEMDQAIDSWMSQYEAKQIARDRLWWYPESTTGYRKSIDKNKTK